MEATLISKILVLILLLAIAVHADPASPLPIGLLYPPPSNDSPPPPAGPEIALPPPLLPGFPDIPVLPIPGLDPRIPRQCIKNCAMKCGRMHGFRRAMCRAQCMVMCRIKPSDHASFDCTRDCVMNGLHHDESNTQNLDGLVNTCFSRCNKHV